MRQRCSHARLPACPHSSVATRRGACLRATRRLSASTPITIVLFTRRRHNCFSPLAASRNLFFSRSHFAHCSLILRTRWQTTCYILLYTLSQCLLYFMSGVATCQPCRCSGVALIITVLFHSLCYAISVIVYVGATAPWPSATVLWRLILKSTLQ